MAYIGNRPTSNPFVVDTYSGTGSQTVFTGLTFAPAGTASIAVFVGGSYVAPTLYILSGTTITFNTAPAAGTNNIRILHLGVGAVSSVPTDGSVTTQKLGSNLTLSGNTTTTGNLTIGGSVTGNLAVTGAITEAGFPIVAQTDIGTAPNQIPLNQYLGNLAYQNADAIAGPVTAAGPVTTPMVVTESSMGFRNRIINGAMQIDQRNAGAAVTASSSATYAVDRFQAIKDTAGATVTTQQSTTAPTGFTNSYVWTTSTGASPGASDDSFVRHNIEGYNVDDFGFGASGAKSITLSFWVRSSLTGTFGGVFANSASNRARYFSYSISSANTWEYKTVTVEGDTTGTWVTNNGVGLRLIFDLGAGTSRSASVTGAWGTYSGPGLTGGVKVVGTTGATWQITGVQLEAGSVATPFERRPYGTELMLCQRYFVKDLQDGSEAVFLVGVIDSTTSCDRCGMRFPVAMRTSPTAAIGGTSNPRIYDGAAAPAITSIAKNASSSFGASLALTASGGGLTSTRVALIIDNSGSFITYSAEL